MVGKRGECCCCFCHLRELCELWRVQITLCSIISFKKSLRVSNSFGHLNMDSTIFYCEVKRYISQALTLPALSVRYNNKNSLIALINVMKQLVHALIITITKLLNLIGYQLPWLQPLYYHMKNFCNLICLEQWYFSLIWNTCMWKLQTFCG